MTREEFSAQYSEHLPKLVSYISARIGDRDNAEDIASDVFLKALAALDRFDGQKASFSTWLYTIAANAVRDHLRRREVRGRFLTTADDAALEAVPSEDEFADVMLCRRELLDGLADALMELPEKQRQIIVLQYYDGLPQKQIAEMLGVSFPNTRYLSSKAVKALRGSLQKRSLL